MGDWAAKLTEMLRSLDHPGGWISVTYPSGLVETWVRSDDPRLNEKTKEQIDV